jgi:hypothetical protein
MIVPPAPAGSPEKQPQLVVLSIVAPSERVASWTLSVIFPPRPIPGVDELMVVEAPLNPKELAVMEMAPPLTSAASVVI